MEINFLISIPEVPQYMRRSLSGGHEPSDLSGQTCQDRGSSCFVQNTRRDDTLPMCLESLQV